MRTPFYSIPEHLERYHAVIAQAMGTPFATGSGVLGPRGGADCVGLVEAIHIACGACQKLEYERRPLDWSRHNQSSPIVDFLKGLSGGRLAMMDPEDERINGDIVTVRTGHGVHHVGVWVSDIKGRHLFHVPVGESARRWSIDNDALKGRVSGIWRINTAQ